MTIDTSNCTANRSDDTREEAEFETIDVPKARLNTGTYGQGSLRTAAILTFLIALLFTLITGGTAIVYQFIAIWRVARKASPPDSKADWLIIPGVSLDGSEIGPDFRARLHRVLAMPSMPNILILGGCTGSATVAESVAGAQWLINRHVDPSRIVAEISSRHTLENLRAAREILAQKKATTPVVVTNRYHLRRIDMFSKTMGLQLLLCPAEEEWRPTSAVWTSILFEAFWLHWHASGQLLWALTGSDSIKRTIG